MEPRGADGIHVLGPEESNRFDEVVSGLWGGFSDIWFNFRCSEVCRVPVVMLFQLQPNDAKSFLDSLLEAPQTFIIIIPAELQPAARPGGLMNGN